MGNKVIAVWGSHGSGKTLTAVKMVKVLSEKKANIIIACADADTPVMPLLLPSESNTASIGDLLALPNITDTAVLKHCVPWGKYIGVLGYGLNENIRTYPDYSLQRAKDLISILRKTADYTIIDCTSHTAGDLFTDAALEDADITFKIVNPNLKSISYLKSQKPLLQSSRYNYSGQINIINNILTSQDVSPICEFLGNKAYRLPHVDALQEQFDSGKLLETVFGKNAKEYTTSIMTLVGEVIP